MAPCNPPLLGSVGSRPQVQPAGAICAQAGQRPQQQPDRRCRSASRLRGPTAVPARVCCLRARICCLRGRLFCDGLRIVERVPGGMGGLSHTPAGPDVCLCLSNACRNWSKTHTVCFGDHAHVVIVEFDRLVTGACRMLSSAGAQHLCSETSSPRCLSGLSPRCLSAPSPRCLSAP
jgi:hypothetical protein